MAKATRCRTTSARAREARRRSRRDADHDPRRVNPELRIEWFEELFARVRVEYPDVDLHSLSVSEIVGLSTIENLPVRDVLNA